MRVVFAGTPEAAVPALDAVAASRHELVAVVTRPDAPVGRGRKLAASPVARAAREHAVPVLKPRRPREPDFQAGLRELAPDCCPVVAYGALLPDTVLAIPPQGWVNLHFSLLPAWRGAAPVQRALLAGDDVTGATTFLIVPELDAGPVYGVMTEAVRPRDTAGDLLARLAIGGADLLVRTLDAIEDGSAEARPQPHDGVTLAPKISAADAHVDWTESALAVDRRVRACTPAPGAWTRYAGDRVKLGPVVPAEDRPALEPGALQVGKAHVHVGTRTVPVRLGEVRVSGKRPMPAADWARGARLTHGARFGG